MTLRLGNCLYPSKVLIRGITVAQGAVGCGRAWPGAPGARENGDRDSHHGGEEEQDQHQAGATHITTHASCLLYPFHGCGSAVISSGSGSSILGWIPIRIQGFHDQKMEKNFSWKKKNFFGSKTTIYRYLSLGLHKERSSYRRSLQISKEAIQHFKAWTFKKISTFVGHFCPPGSGSATLALFDKRSLILSSFIVTFRHILAYQAVPRRSVQESTFNVLVKEIP